MFFILLLLFLLPVDAFSFELNVKAFSDGKPLPYTTVKVWKKATYIRNDNHDFLFKCDEKGSVRFSLEAGEYYFFAEKETDANYYFGFFGQNPFSVRRNEEISINLVQYGKDFIRSKKELTISGNVLFNNKPVKDVQVLAYLDLTSDLKGPAFLSTYTDEKGYFSLDLSEGSYYLIFRKKASEIFGPPSPGDYVGFFPIFPLEINKKGYNLKVNLLKIPEKMRANLLDKNYVVKGVVLGKDKKPKKGVYVVLYGDYTLMGKPDYVSHKTDEKGEFLIHVAKKGSYFVVLRKTLGDTPQIGEDVSSFTEISVDDDSTTKTIVITTND